MSHEKKEIFKLSHESDGVMGKETKGKEQQKYKNEFEFAEEFFFNTTQNSE